MRWQHFIVKCVSPNKSLDGGADYAGEQKQGGDQDMKEGQRGEGHSWRQVSVLWDVNVNHKCLRDEREDRLADISVKSMGLDHLTLELLIFHTW